MKSNVWFYKSYLEYLEKNRIEDFICNLWNYKLLKTVHQIDLSFWQILKFFDYFIDLSQEHLLVKLSEKMMKSMWKDDEIQFVIT